MMDLLVFCGKKVKEFFYEFILLLLGEELMGDEILISYIIWVF